MNFARLRIGVVLVGVATALLLGTTETASAQDTVETSPVTAKYKGSIGLGLIGAELGFVLPAAFGAKPWWMYLVFPVVGAAGGATAGYFLLEKDGGHPEVAVAMLVTGAALIIPALVFTVARTSYNADEDMPTHTQQAALRSAPPAERRAAEAGPGLVRVAEGGELMLRAPSVTVGRTLSREEALRTGAQSQREYQVAVLSGRF